MSDAPNTNEALKRIKHCAETRDTFLDLGGLNLTSIPDEIVSLSEHLEILIFGQWPWDPVGNTPIYESEKLRDSTPITNLAHLKGFPNLHTLDLSDTRVSDFAPLKELPSLQSLDLSFISVSDLGPLIDLPSLQLLNLDFTNVSDLGPLKDLPSLQLLSLSYTQVSNLAPLKNLPSLQSLSLSSTQVSDLAPLKDLSSLQSLDLSFAQVSDLAPLKDLSSLQSLNLNSTRVSDLAPLKDLSSLQSLDLDSTQVSDFAPLKDLSSLQSLSLSYTQVSDLTPLKDLSSLQSLSLSYTQVSDLTPLKDLPSLQSLDFESTQVSDLSPLETVHSLQKLSLSQTNVASISSLILDQLNELMVDQLQDGTPSEILSKDSFDDSCLSRIRSYRAALSKGKLTDIELKVFILGNGRVGKTQITRFLRELPFDPAIPTTHGVQIHRLPFPLDDGDQTHLNIWDFGGQDIYHSTHSLFLRSRALFLLLWNPESEELGDFEENGIPMRNERLPYWTEYIRSQSDPDTPVLIIQSQCESAALESPNPPADLSKLTGFKRSLVFGAESKWGAESLLASLKDAVRSVRQTQSAPIILTGWAKLKTELLRQLKEEKRRLLSQEEFHSLCNQVGDIDDPELALHYLHHNGILYYDHEKIPDQIILDQNYALTPIYDLFDRGGCYQNLRDLKHGRFTRADLGLFLWDQKGYSSSEQELFLRFMVSCGICFATGEKRGEQDEYLCPDLLPERSAVASLLIGRWEKDSPEIQRTEFQFTFLHRGIVRDLLAKIGNEAGNSPVYWRDGCWFYEAQTHCSAQITVQPQENGAGSIILEIQGRQTSALLNTITKILTRISGQQNFKTVSEDQAAPDRDRERRNTSQDPSRSPGSRKGSLHFLRLGRRHSGRQSQRRNRRTH